MSNQLRSIKRNVGTVEHSSRINWGESYEVAIGQPKKVKEIVQESDGAGWYYWSGAWNGPFETEQQADNAFICDVAERIAMRLTYP